MADERIIELDTINEVPADGYLAIDTVTGDTYKILPIKIGAQYTIQDGDHSFTLVGSNGYSHTVNIPYDSETINLADFNQLTPEEQDNGTAYYVPDKDVPVADELWAKVGRTQLDGTTQDLSKAHNNLMTRVDDLEDTVGDTALPSGMSSVTDGISQLNSSLTKYYIATADVNCTNTASNSWGFWGYTTIDLSQLLADKTLISITPQLCILKGDPAVIGLMSFTYNASNHQLIPRVNFKNSGTFSVQFEIKYK